MSFRTVILCLVICASPAFAQHTDIFVYQRDGSLVATNATNEERIYSRLFDFFGHPFGNTNLPKAFVADDPGFQSNDSPIAGTSVLPADEVLRGDFLAYQIPDGTAGNLLHWDTMGDVSFQSVPTGHFFNITDVSGDDGFVLNGDSSPIEDVLLGLVDSSSSIHEHINWRLDDGDGNENTDPQAGIYLMMMQLKMPGIDNSQPFAVLLNSTDVTVSVQDAASEWVDDNFDSISIVGDMLQGDYDGNGQFELADIDELVAAVANMSDENRFDLNGDGAIDLQDIGTWRAIAGAANLPSMGAYLAGDGNLDGVVDISDFNVWNNNKFTSVAAWSRGDFNADGVVDISDFNVWNGNKFLASDNAVVPEPSTALPLMLGVLCVILRARKP